MSDIATYKAPNLHPQIQAPSPEDLVSSQGGVDFSSVDQPAPQPRAPMGPVKRRLMNFLEGFGDGAAKAVGLPTEQERQLGEQQIRLNQFKLETEQLDSQLNRDYRVSQTKKNNADTEMVSVVNPVTGQNITVRQKDLAGMQKVWDQIQGRQSLETGKEIWKSGENTQDRESRQKIADAKLASYREATKQRLEMAQRIASGHDATTLQARKMGVDARFVMQGMKSYDLALDSDARLQQMYEQAKDPNPAGDKALLFNHIAMTIGNVKGGRVTQAEIEAHLKARDLASDVMQAWDRVATGKSLTPEQRQNFLKLGEEVRTSAWDRAYRRADFFGVENAPEDNPVLPPANTHVAKPGNQSKTAAEYLKKHGLK